MNLPAYLAGPRIVTAWGADLAEAVEHYINSAAAGRAETLALAFLAALRADPTAQARPLFTGSPEPSLFRTAITGLTEVAEPMRGRVWRVLADDELADADVSRALNIALWIERRPQLDPTGPTGPTGPDSPADLVPDPAAVPTAPAPSALPAPTSLVRFSPAPPPPASCRRRSTSKRSEARARVPG